MKQTISFWLVVVQVVMQAICLVIDIMQAAATLM